jgi:ABC-2 type transport system permease protein
LRRISPQLTVNPADTDWLDRLLVVNLLPEAGPEQLERLRQPFYEAGPESILVTPEGQAEGQSNSLMPFLVTIAIIIPLFTSGSYLFQSLTEEKSSRVMEILLVSLRPRQLLAGKIVGLSALTLVQYVIWLGVGALALLVTGQGPELLQSGLSLSLAEIGLIIPFALAGFGLYAGLMAGIGALARDVEDSRAWLFILGLPMMLPIYLWPLIASSPHSPLAVTLSLIPFSAPVAMVMRMTSSAVPPWQIGVSLLLLILTSYILIRLMARLFRAQTLLSGESISIRRFWAALTS